MDVVATFRVEYTQFLNPQGDATRSLPEFARDPAALLPLYRAMVRTRLFDAKAITLQRTGKLGTFASSLGQEAIGVGVASAIRAHGLAQQGILAEVIDVATLKPLDMKTILDSTAKTGRCVIVHEAARTAGYGAEIAANLAEHGLYSLAAPVQRVTGYDVVVPLAKLEYQFMPNVDRIVSAARKALEAA